MTILIILTCLLVPIALAAVVIGIFKWPNLVFCIFAVMVVLGIVLCFTPTSLCRPAIGNLALLVALLGGSLFIGMLAAIIVSAFKWPRLTFGVFGVIVTVGIALLSTFWIKEMFFTSSFDHWLSKAQWEYSTRTVWGDDPCPEALSCLSKALEVWKPSEGLEKKLNALSWRAKELSLEHKNEEAIYDYDQAIKIDPQEFQFYLERGGVLLDSGKNDGAIADFTKALELTGYPKAVTYIHSKHSFLAPQYANNTYCSRGDAYFRKKDYSRAILDFTEMIKQEPEEMKREPPVGYEGYVGEAYHLRAKAYNLLGQYDKAIEDFSKCIAFNVSVYIPQAYRERGYAYMQTKQFAKAIDDFTKANDKETTSRYKWFNYHERALAYKELGQSDKANQDNIEAEKLKLWVAGKNGMKYLTPN